MNIRIRRFLLAIASLLDGRAQALRRYVKARTPKRVTRLKSVEDVRTAA